MQVSNHLLGIIAVSDVKNYNKSEENIKGKRLTALSLDKMFPENMLANDLETLAASFFFFGFFSFLNVFNLVTSL